MRTTTPISLVSLVALTLAAAGVRLPTGVEIVRNVSYGPSAMHRLDAYLQRGRGPHPAVVFVHGGGFVGGDKAAGGLPLLLHLAATHGYSVISINYRLAPTHRHPAQVEDVRRAVRWLRSHGDRFRLDPQRLALGGSSAGGYLVTFVAYTPCESPRTDTPSAAHSCHPRTVVNLFGPTDLREMFQGPITALLGPGASKQIRAAASPIVHVSAGDPPTLTIHGTADPLVPYRQSVALHRALSAAGVPQHLVSVEGGNHGGNWLALGEQTRAWQQALVDWLATYLRQ